MYFYFETFSLSVIYHVLDMRILFTLTPTTQSFDVLNMHVFVCLLHRGVHRPGGVCMHVCLWGEGACLCEL